MVDLVQWLTACLDEDERKTRAIPVDLGHEWSDPGPWVMAGSGGGGREAEVAKVADGLEMPLAEVVAHHIAVWDPARVLREIDAKRRIVDRYAWLREHGDTGGTEWVLPLLALPYADRPGYREEWRP
ncbi:DUF6221 family protein [Streptomyces stelliscabiei]|uniref:Uncharacterized protein n=1 Tax=Streptomyces stelliscabiei TaxID=146820 RepID=A0A8I0P513_9ACTN|nr:DUF6221 family protein [Streptomyces stelliscabiei]KND45358.1 hypothetical protein IQ64_07500 [Streptomyces stelliscabiei]MBE1597182.1 hypothetical protein [Streptomyces stelliscabiei]